MAYGVNFVKPLVTLEIKPRQSADTPPDTTKRLGAERCIVGHLLLLNAPVRGHDTVDFQPLASISNPHEVAFGDWWATFGDRWADLRPEVLFDNFQP